MRAGASDLRGAAKVGRINDGRRDADVRTGWRTCTDVLASGDFRRRHRHDGRGNMTVTATGNVTTRGVARDAFLARDEPGNDFGLEIDDYECCAKDICKALSLCHNVCL